MKLIILQGPPASGKSSWVKDYLDKLTPENRKQVVVVSRDAIRQSTGTYWVQEREDYISTLEDTAMKEALKKGLTVINDATNLNPKTIKHLEEIAAEFNAEIEIKSFYVPFKEAVARDYKRGQEGGLCVTRPVIKGFYQRYFLDKFIDEEYIDHRKLNPIDDTKKHQAVICDLDGTIALHTSGRSPFEYERVGEDSPNSPLITVLQKLQFSGVKLIFLTGRENIGNCETETKKWLDKYFSDYLFFLRDNGNKISSAIFKKKIYDEKIKDKYTIISVFEDANNCVEMWRNEGLNCCQIWNNEY